MRETHAQCVRLGMSVVLVGVVWWYWWVWSGGIGGCGHMCGYQISKMPGNLLVAMTTTLLSIHCAE